MTHDQPTPTPVVPVLTPIPMPNTLGGPPVQFEPHNRLCAAFAERTSAYLRELGTLTTDMRTLAAAIPSPVTRHDPRQQPLRQRLHAERQAALQRLVARMVSLRGELNAHLAAAALACSGCAESLSTQRWPLPGSEDLLSEVLRRAAENRCN